MKWGLIVGFALGLCGCVPGGAGGEDAGPGAPDAGPPPACALDADCVGALANLAPCETAACDGPTATCVRQDRNAGAPCDDGDACTTYTTCDADGACAAGTPRECDDGNACTDDRCDEATGCVHLNNVAPCDDGATCTVGDQCQNGACQSGVNECPCTDQTDCAAFEDGDACNGTLLCQAAAPTGVCVVDPATFVNCDDSLDGPCQKNRCQPDTGACEVEDFPDGAACDDGNACTEGQTCAAGQCSAGEALTCESDTDCADPVCIPSTGCVLVDNGSCAECNGIECLACSQLADCAEGAAELIAGTCCGVGDALVKIGQGTAAEAVDIEVDGRYALLCGGFGVRVNRIDNPFAPVLVGQGAGRCQRSAFGPVLPDGTRTVYLAHHGDTWVPQAFIQLWALRPDETFEQVATYDEPGVLYEGMAVVGQTLYAATHGGGVRVYNIDAAGLLTFVDVLEGFDNATRLAVAGTVMYVADGEGGLKVVDIATPTAPQLLQGLPTRGIARDVTTSGARVFVALGGDGVEVFDAQDPTSLSPDTILTTHGSAQGIDATDDVLAVANWSRVVTYDPVTLARLASEDIRIFPRFDQNFGVAVRDDLIYVAEWEGLHVLHHRPGYAAPDINFDEELFSFNALSPPSARAVIVRNRGQLPLHIDNILLEDPDVFFVDTTTLNIAPHSAGVVELLYDPPSGGQSLNSKVTFITNDPDPAHAGFEMHLIATDSAGLNVGDALTDPFGFLDPTGAGELSNLQGNVLVLAYFALF